MVVGTLLNVGLGLITFTTEYGAVVGPVLSFFSLLSVIGLIVVWADPCRKTGLYVLMVGSLGYLPAGIIAIIGALKHIEAINRVEFKVRRAAVGTISSFTDNEGTSS